MRAAGRVILGLWLLLCARTAFAQASQSSSGLGCILLIFLLAVYFLPSIIGRNKRNATAICMLNLLLGWTVIGWVVALVWALTYEEPR
jgi:hypothetical protein